MHCYVVVTPVDAIYGLSLLLLTLLSTPLVGCRGCRGRVVKVCSLLLALTGICTDRMRTALCLFMLGITGI
jgi:hypothetical protein